MPFRSHCRLTADKKEIKDFRKLSSCLRADTHRQAATSFIRKPLNPIEVGSQKATTI